MLNSSLGLKGQELVAEWLEDLGCEVRRSWRTEPLEPFDLLYRVTSREAWTKVQVKTTRKFRDGRLVFRTRKTRKGRKVPYARGDFHQLILVDASSKTLLVRSPTRRGFVSFDRSTWKKNCSRPE